MQVSFKTFTAHQKYAFQFAHMARHPDLFPWDADDLCDMAMDALNASTIEENQQLTGVLRLLDALKPAKH